MRIEHRDSDEVLMAQVLVLLTRASANETAEAVAVARQVFDQYGHRGIEALSRVVGAHLAIRKLESGDGRAPRRIARETQRAMGRDPALVAAQSQMVLIEKALERVFPRDVGARHGIMEVAKERIAQHLGQGHSFAQARIIEPIQDLDRSERNKDEARQNRNGGRVRIQQRER